VERRVRVRVRVCVQKTNFRMNISTRATTTQLYNSMNFRRTTGKAPGSSGSTDIQATDIIERERERVVQIEHRCVYSYRTKRTVRTRLLMIPSCAPYIQTHE
jgi:hypothetical protein